MRGRLYRRRHAAFLAAIAATFLVRPLLGDSPVALIAFNFAVIGLLLLAVLTVEADAIAQEGRDRRTTRRWWRRATWLLAAVVFAERVGTIVFPDQRLTLVGTASFLLFFAFVAASHFRTLLRSERVTGETIAMSISTYLLIALVWSMAYELMLELPEPAAAPATTARRPVRGSAPNESGDREPLS